MIPLVPLSAEKFRSLRDLMEGAGFTEDGLCARLKIRNLGELKAPGEGREPEALDSACSLLTHLFLDRESAPAGVVEDRLGKDGAELLGDFGLLRPAPTDPGARLATVMLYPARGVYVASDRDWEPETGRGTLPRADAVYLAITPSACDFLDALPVSGCEELLELCSGAGAAALIAARFYAKSACACDVLERCARFAEWSARLNGAANVSVLTGDLYEPVRGRQFDRIVAHPPYRPSSEQTHVFRDGGLDGEQITRGIIQGLPTMLRPGGQCYLTAAFAAMESAPIETRIREMLGAGEGEFDVFVAARRHMRPEDVFDLKEPARRFHEAGITGFVRCSVALQRRASSRPVFTIRKETSVAPGPMIEWVLRWEAMLREPGFADRLLRERLTAPPGVRLNIVHTLGHKKWTPSGATLAASRPFPVELDCPPWVSDLIERCDGRATLRDALETLKARGTVPAQASGVEFARLVQMLISAGFLEFPALPLPS